MLDQLSLILVAAAILLVPATALVFTIGQRPTTRRIHLSPQIVKYRLIVAAIGTGVVAYGVDILVSGDPGRSAVSAIVVAASVLAWLPLTRVWAGRGVLAWALIIDAGAAYLAYVLLWSFTAELSWAGLLASLLLWLVEAFVFLIGLAYLWEFVDVLARRAWPSYIDPRQIANRHFQPFVSLHVPIHNEPPDLVIATLERLLEQDYDYYEIVVIDNNTTDPALWRPVEAFCAQHWRIKFLHIEDWPGFKSGALNYALKHADLRAEVIGVVDADYLVRPDFLSDCAPMFADPTISFVQTPQDYRGWDLAAYFRRLYYSYGYFFDVSQLSRNERNGAIFGGTMGLIRRSALVSVGGWNEWCITEDAEVSLRLLEAGGNGVHVDRSYGTGVMPLTFEALKRQRFRWCFGGVQILRMHWRSLLPGRRTETNALTPGQRWSYLTGGLQWFGDVASVLFTGFLLLGALDMLLGGGELLRQVSGFLLMSVVVIILLGASRAVALIRRTSNAGWREAWGALGLWHALSWTVANAALRGLFARRGVFLRTPKVHGEPNARYALRGNLTEALLAVLCSTVGLLALAELTLGGAVVGMLLLAQAAGFAAAPLNSLAAVRSHLPEELRRRRRLTLSSWGPPARRGSMILAAAVVGAVVFLAPFTTPGLRDLGQGTDVQEAAPGASTPPSDSDSDGERQRETADGTPSPTSAPPTDSRTTRPARSAEPTRTPTSVPQSQPTDAPTSDQPGRPTDKPTPPGHTKDPPGRPDDHPNQPNG